MREQRKTSLASSVTVRMAAGIALVVLASAVGSYFQVLRGLEEQTTQYLNSYLRERGRHESETFVLVHQWQGGLRDILVSRLAVEQDRDCSAAFDTLFEKWDDGTTRTKRSLFDGAASEIELRALGITGFVGRDVEVTPELKCRLVLAYELLSSAGPAWSNVLENLYISTNENVGLIYWPGVPWDLDVPPESDLAQGEWHLAAAPERNPERKTVWSDPYYDDVAGAWMVSCVTPIDIDGQHVGYIGSDLTLDALFTRTFEDYLPEAYSFIVQQDGRMVAHAAVMKQLHEGNKALDVREFNKGALAAIYEWARKALAGVETAATHQGRQYIGATRIHGPEWFLVMVFPDDYVASSAITTGRLVVAFGLLTLVVTVAWLFYILQRSVVAPLRSFVRLSDRIASGKFSEGLHEQLPVQRTDEIGDLAKSFGTMTIQLDDAFTRLKSRAEEQVRLVSAIEQASEAIIISDLDGVIEFVNPAFEQVTGFPAYEATGRNVSILHGDTQSPIFGGIRTAASEGKVFRNTVEWVRKDGQQCRVDISVAGVHAPDGNIVALVCVARDTTREERLEAQLRQAQKMEAIGTLAGGIAHDFNNLLAAILGYTEMACEELSPGHAAGRLLEEVTKAGLRAKDLVTQILTFSRRAPRQLVPVYLPTIVDEAVRLIRASVPATIEINQRTDGDIPFFCADPSQLHQIVVNLCTNACQAMPDGGILDVAVSKELVEVGDSGLQPGTYVVLSVSDTGLGMDNQTIEHAFEPFYTTKGQVEGTGLGLATVHGIVTSLNGAIFVESSPGQGSRFRIYLPTDPSVELPADAVGESHAPARGHGQHIMVVEDESSLLRLAQRNLEKLGYRATGFDSPLDALQAFAKGPMDFDLVLTDENMPKMKGLQLIRKIHSVRPDMPVLLATGFSNAVDKDALASENVRVVLRKPYSLFDLATALRGALSQTENK